MTSPFPLEVLTSARQIATHAERLGMASNVAAVRPTTTHLGAMLADAVLQAGLNYRTVVKPRIHHIQKNYPHAARLSGVKIIIEEGSVPEFLLWNHFDKISRFIQIANLLDIDGVEDSNDLQQWLKEKGSRSQLLKLRGIGPKTFDYLCCLVGIDRIAVDRHVKTFASEAGVLTSDYNNLQAIVSYAADLLDVPRRDFDAWIWSHQVRKSSEPTQYGINRC